MNKNAHKAKHILRTLAAVVLLAWLTGCASTNRQAPPGQLYHVGLVWLKEPGNPEHRQRIIDAAHQFASHIPEVRFLSVGKSVGQTNSLTDTSFDLCVVMRFDNQEAMNRYGRNPVHEKAAQEAFLPLSRKILFYDFISE